MHKFLEASDRSLTTPIPTNLRKSSGRMQKLSAVGDGQQKPSDLRLGQWFDLARYASLKAPYANAMADRRVLILMFMPKAFQLLSASSLQNSGISPLHPQQRRFPRSHSPSKSTPSPGSSLGLRSIIPECFAIHTDYACQYNLACGCPPQDSPLRSLTWVEPFLT